MPVTKSAQKKLRQDKKRNTINALVKTAFKIAIKKLTKPAEKSTSKKELARKAASTIDKAVKKKIIHKNKAARLKSRVSKLSR
jgi:small subunit ribosomal protein S20